MPGDRPFFYPNGHKNCGLGTTIRNTLFGAGGSGGAYHHNAHAGVQPALNWSGESSGYASLSDSSSLLSRPIPAGRGGRTPADVWDAPRWGPGVGKGRLEGARASARKPQRNGDAIITPSSSSDKGMGTGRPEEGPWDGAKEGDLAPGTKKQHHHHRLQQRRVKRQEHWVKGKDGSHRRHHHGGFEGTDKPSWSRRSSASTVNTHTMNSAGWPAKTASDAGFAKAGDTTFLAAGIDSSTSTSNGLRGRDGGLIVDAAGRDSEWTAERRAASREAAELLGEIRHNSTRLWQLVGGGV